MADISKIKVGEVTYDLKDEVARGQRAKIDNVTITKNADDELQAVGVTDGETPINYKQIKTGILPYKVLKKKKDYLYDIYYNNINYDFANEYFETKRPNANVGGCSSVRNGNFYGRNLDWLYSEKVGFVVSIPRNAGRYASVGVVSNVSDENEALTKAFVESGKYSDLYKILPFMIVDGINEFGVVCNTNVVPRQKNNGNVIHPSGTVEQTICQIMLPRFILDNFKTATEAVNYIKEHLEMFPSKTLSETYNYDQHWMVADGTKTYLIECVNSNIVVTEMVEHPYMTNFYLNGVTLNADGTVYTPETQTATEKPTTTNGITSLGSGLERYNLIVNNYNTANTKTGMRSLMNSLLYTRAYNTSSNPSNPYWYTEFVGNGLTVDSATSQFTQIVNEAGQKFLNRSRDESSDNFGTWQTMHSVVYDIANKKIYLVAQEDVDNEYEYDFEFAAGGVPQELLDRIETIEGDIDNLEGDVDAINDDIETINNNIQTLSDGLQTAEQDIQEINTELDNISEDVADLETNVADLEQGLQDVEGDVSTLQTNVGTLTTDVNNIKDVIPDQASSSNKLADKAFVNSTVQTATANFRGNWMNWASVPMNADEYPADYTGTKTPSTNDYMVVQDASGYVDPQTTLAGTWRFKYTGVWATDGRNGWHPEYQVNETPLTAAQLAALNSGITTSLVEQIGRNEESIYDLETGKQDLIDNDNKLDADLVDDTSSTNKFVTNTEKATWNGKSVVSVSDTGTATDEVKYITINGVEKKIGGGSIITIRRY